MYMPTLARFTARDPMPPDGEPVLLGVSPYQYAENNPTNEVDPSGLQAAKGGAPANPCKVDVACARIGLPIGPKHCGVEVSDPSGTTRLHVRGTKGICDPLPGRVALGWTGSYWIAATSTHPQSVCDCIRDTAKLINSKGLPYSPSPNAPCGPRAVATCNSNYTTYCLLAKCGVSTAINWGWTGIPEGWNHRMTECKKWHWVTPTPGPGPGGNPGCQCVCDERVNIDGDWCA